VKHDNPTNSTEKLLLNGKALKHYGVPALLSFIGEISSKSEI
jgi:hypothetical protein